MISEYPLRTIGDLCYVTDGAHAKVERQTTGTLYLTSKNIRGGTLSLKDADFISAEDYERLFSNSKRAQRRPVPGDVLTGIIGTFGNAYLYKKNDHFGVSSAVALLRPDPKQLIPEYLYYVMTSKSFRAAHSAYKAGSVQGYTNIPTIKALHIPVPPLHIQRAISGILGSLDRKIDLNRRMNETLDATARAIFKSWFVDFDPVSAKSNGRHAASMSAQIMALFPSEFSASSLGNTPSGWTVAAIGSVVRVLGGSTPRTEIAEYWTGGSIAWATPKDLAALADPVLLDTERHITASGLAQISSGLLPAGTVLLSSRAPIGYLAITEVPVAVNQGFIAMVCDGALPNQYVLHWARVNTEAITARANGTTFLEISKTNFRPIEVLVPAAPVLKAFTNIVTPLYQRMVNNLRESQTLAAVRDTLLPKLISGEVRVKGAEKVLQAVHI